MTADSGRVVMSVFYPDQPDGRFDLDAYLTTHIPLVRQRWTALGLLDLRVLRGTATPAGAPAPYRVLALLTFSSAEALQHALAEHSAEIFAHIPCYTDIAPVMQVSEIVE